MSNLYSLDLEKNSSQYAAIADGSQTGLDLSTDFSGEAWIKLESLPSTAGAGFPILSKWNATSNQFAYIFLINDSDKLVLIFSDNGTYGATAVVDVRDSGTTVSSGDLGSWIHFAFTADISAGAAGVTLYKNGSALTPSTTQDGATTIFNSTASFAIGAAFNDATLTYLDGLVDEVRVWSTIRTSQEILDNKGRELVGNESGLVGYWKFNNNYLDETSNNNDLTASGSPVFSTSVPFVGDTGFFLMF